MSNTNWWPSDYFASREKFIALGQSIGARMESHLLTAIGPQGEALSVDVASVASTSDEHLIILTSGVHGVEGFLGATIQMHVLDSLAQSDLPSGTGIVMVHAANPWGFAHLRRVDHNNIDVNRNFIEPRNAALTSHPLYASLDPVINPRKLPNIIGELKYWLSASKLIAKNRGIEKLLKPIAEGQYDFAQGVFYGGAQVSESCSLLQDIVLNLSSNAKRVSVLDIHTGLGRSACASLIGNCNFIAEERRKDWVAQYFGQPVYIDTHTNNAYDAKGTFSQWCQHSLSDKQFLYLCVEIGTVNPIKLFTALRRENQAHHWADNGSVTYVQTKEALQNVFAPRSEHWRRKSIERGLSIVNRTIDLPISASEFNVIHSKDL